MTKSSLQQIIQALNDAKVRYLVIGGLAVVAHGYIRLTSDVDLLIDLEETNILTALRALKALGYVPTISLTIKEFANASTRQRWFAKTQTKSLKLQSGAHQPCVDVLASDPIGFDSVFSRFQHHALTDTLQIPICSFEDLVEMKTQRERPKDLLDLQQLKMARAALSLPIEDPWAQCTFEGSERANLRRTASLSFAEKLDWLEDARQLA